MLSVNEQNEIFFKNNIKNVNASVEKILLATVLVPCFFIILTLAGIWRVPHFYSIFIICFSLSSFAIMHLMNRKTELQQLAMFFGVFATAVFVELLAIKSLISINITYAAAPFISCMYFNRKLTICTTVVSFFLMILSFALKSFNIIEVLQTNLLMWQTHGSWYWFFDKSLGYGIEFIFIFLIAYYMAKRSHRIINHFAKVLKDRREKTHLLRVQNEKLHYAQDQLFEFIAKVLGSHDLFTGRHVNHTKVYVRLIAEKLRDNGFYTEELSEKNIHLFETAAFLHDIGKIHIPEGVLNKIGKFTPAEFEIMKSHPEEGKNLLELLPQIGDGTFNKIAIDMAFTHHEKWNGKGYPCGIKGEQIPLCGRIMAAADVLDALISKRLYKDPFTIDDALKVFADSKGTHFEECIAQAVIDCREEIIKIDAGFKKTEAETEEKEFNWWKNYHDNLKQVAMT